MLINDDVFPFRFQVDRNLVITEVGSSLTKLCKQFRQGATLAALIRFCCPETDVTYSDITQLQRQPVELELSDSGVRMQGQIVVEEDVLCFLGAPEFESPHELERHGLTRADFAIQDSAVQNMMLRWHHNSRLEGLRKALDELEVAATRKANLACVEDTLANELGSAGDLVLQIDMDGRILDLRTSRCDRLPGERGELIGMLLRDRLPGLYRSLTDARHEHARVGVTIGFEFKLNKLQNEYVYDARATRTAHDVMVILAKDVTETKRLEHHLRRQASHDVLTGLPNRTMVEREVQQALTSGGNQAVLLFELDDFKAINERHGHHTGDKLLVEVARVLRRGIRANDFVARLGGDEFAVLLRNIRDHKQATLVAERVLESINRVFQIDEMCARVSASVGVATNKEAATAEELFRNADIAMYRAKSRAKERANLPNPDRIELFESHMYADFVERFTLRQELDQGLDRGEIVNHYQTIHQLETGRIRGIEALARWNHPTRGMLVPAEFIEIAEESGLIIALGEAVLMNACRDARVLASKFRNAPVSVHVNISPIQIAKSDIVATVREALARFELEPQFLTLEITEKALFAGFEQAERVFTELKSIGVNVALDDFGVGYCSLKYLERFPIDFLKLDGSFIHELGRLEAKNRLVQSIVNLGRALDMEIIAEGVEKVVQAQFLRQYGCHNVQGFLYTRPMPFELLKHHVTCQIFDIHADAHIGVAADGTRTDEGSREASQNTDTSTAISQPWLWSEPETGTTVETVHGNGSYSDGDDPECIGESAIQAYCQLSLKDVQN